MEIESSVEVADYDVGDRDPSQHYRKAILMIKTSELWKEKMFYLNENTSRAGKRATLKLEHKDVVSTEDLVRMFRTSGDELVKI